VCYGVIRLYTAGVRENSEIGLPLLQLTATDADLADNARLQYVLCTHSDEQNPHPSVSQVINAAVSYASN